MKPLSKCISCIEKSTIFRKSPTDLTPFWYQLLIKIVLLLTSISELYHIGKAWKLLFMTLKLFLVLIKYIHDLKKSSQNMFFFFFSKVCRIKTSPKSNNLHIKSFPWIDRKISIHGLFLLVNVFIEVHLRDAIKLLIFSHFHSTLQKILGYNLFLYFVTFGLPYRWKNMPT